MSRTTKILLAVLAVMVVGAGAYFAMNWSKVTDLLNGNKNTAVVANTNAAVTNTTTNRATNLNVSLPSEVKGSVTLNGNLTVGGVKLHFGSLQWTNQYLDVKAATGKTLLVIFVDQLTAAQIAPVVDVLSQDVKLQVGGTSVDVRRFKIASDQIKNDRGYLLFEVPTNATNIALVRGSGPSSESVSIPAK